MLKVKVKNKSSTSLWTFLCLMRKMRFQISVFCIARVLREVESSPSYLSINLPLTDNVVFVNFLKKKSKASYLHMNLPSTDFKKNLGWSLLFFHEPSFGWLKKNSGASYLPMTLPVTDEQWMDVGRASMIEPLSSASAQVLRILLMLYWYPTFFWYLTFCWYPFFCLYSTFCWYADIQFCADWADTYVIEVGTVLCWCSTVSVLFFFLFAIRTVNDNAVFLLFSYLYCRW